MNIRLPSNLLNDAYNIATADIAYEDVGLLLYNKDFFNMLDGCAFE